MKKYNVTIPIAGHAYVEVEAENEEDAKEKAMDKTTTDIEWEYLDQFNKGNVCYCPSPWEIEVEEIDE
jgi:hypothetical protein